MSVIRQHKVVAALPYPLAADSLYYVRVGAGFDIYVTNSAGVVVAYSLNAQIRLNDLIEQVESLERSVAAVATEALPAGAYVNYHGNGGVFSVRLADNSLGLYAEGYVTQAVAEGATATVYPLDGINSALAGLTTGGRYWLGLAGGVAATPLDSTDAANSNKVSQYLGVAKSATELVTDDRGFVIL